MSNKLNNNASSIVRCITNREGVKQRPESLPSRRTFTDAKYSDILENIVEEDADIKPKKGVHLFLQQFITK